MKLTRKIYKRAREYSLFAIWGAQRGIGLRFYIIFDNAVYMYITTIYFVVSMQEKEPFMRVRGTLDYTLPSGRYGVGKKLAKARFFPNPVPTLG